MQQPPIGWLVAIAGPPNAGKSSLVNAMVGRKVSIVSDVPQTTRLAIRGVLTGPDFQLALRAYKDYPGLFTTVEVPREDWGLLPPDKPGADVAPVLIYSSAPRDSQTKASIEAFFDEWSITVHWWDQDEVIGKQTSSAESTR